MRISKRVLIGMFATLLACIAIVGVAPAYGAEAGSQGANALAGTQEGGAELVSTETDELTVAASADIGSVQSSARLEAAGKAESQAADTQKPAATENEAIQSAANAENVDVQEPAETVVSEVNSDEPIVAMAEDDTVDMYRLYNPNSGEHFYTGSSYERASLLSVGWKNEGIGWVAPKISNSPVYRLYNPNAGDHHYTLNSYERDHLVDVGWNYEGIGWYSDDSQRVAVLRQYNPNAEAGAHNFTTSQDENDMLADAGWDAEGIGWYAVDYGSPTSGLSYIYLDAGHGWGSSSAGVYDPGALGNGYREADLTAELVKLTAQYALKQYGIAVYENIGTASTGVAYWDRQADALSRGCTSLVSIHFNASDTGGTGTESYIHPEEAAAGSSQLQSIMHKHLVAGVGITDRGKKQARLSVCNGSETGLAATLLEVCFIDNSYDINTYMAKKDSIARELAAGLYEAACAGF